MNTEIKLRDYSESKEADKFALAVYLKIGYSIVRSETVAVKN